MACRCVRKRMLVFKTAVGCVVVFVSLGISFFMAAVAPLRDYHKQTSVKHFSLLQNAKKNYEKWEKHWTNGGTRTKNVWNNKLKERKQGKCTHPEFRSAFFRLACVHFSCISLLIVVRSFVSGFKCMTYRHKIAKIRRIMGKRSRAHTNIKFNCKLFRR